MEQCSSEGSQSSGTRGPTSPVSPAGYSREPLMEQCSSEGSQSSGTPDATSAVSPAGYSREPVMEQCSSEGSQSSGTPDATFGRVSGRGLAIIDGGTVFLPKMTNQSSKTPGPPSAVSLAGYSREPLMEQCSSKGLPIQRDSKSTLPRVSGRVQPRTAERTVFFRW